MDATKVILFKKEAIYGTDAVPTAAANAFLTRNFSTTPIEVDQLDRNLDVPSRGRSPSAPTNERKNTSFEIEAAGSGVAGTAPAWMELLECCSMEAPVLTATTDAKQKFAAVDAVLSAGTIVDYQGRQRSVGLGSRGTFGFDFTAGAYPFWNFSFISLLPATPVTSAAPGVPDFSRFLDPVEVNDLNTDFTLGGFAAVMRSMNGAAGVNTKIRNLVGSRYALAGNHAITGTLVIETPDPAAKNYFTSLRSGVEIPFNLTHGITAGNIVQMDSDNLQVLGITHNVEDDKLMSSISYGLNIGVGQDDLLITAK